MVSMQISALESSLDFVLHFLRQVSLCNLALGFRLWHFDSKSEAFLDKVSMTNLHKQIPCFRWQTLVAAQHLTKTWNNCQLTGNVG